MPKARKKNSKTGAERITWNLDDLYLREEELEEDIVKSEQEAEDFAQKYRGRITHGNTDGLLHAFQAFERLHDRIGRAFTYVFLHWCTDNEDARRGALLQRVREHYSRISQKVLFFELELIQLGDEAAERIIHDPEFASFRHYLEVLRLRKEHILSEPEEKILAEKTVTGADAWSRLFDEILAGVRFSFQDQQLTEQEILSKLYDPERAVRHDAAMAFTEGLRSHVRTLSYIFNTVLAEKASDDRLRNHRHWLESRNLSNEITDEAVESLIHAVTSHYPLVSRFYHLKRKLLGLSELTDYDRYAPVGKTDLFYSWRDARSLVTEAYSSFHPGMGAIAEDFFRHRWIDARLKPGKRSGAFSHRAVPQVHPYILMNFTANVRDVQTLAHELGHGVHQYLSRKQGSLQAGTPLTTSETASVFGEMLVFDKLLEQQSSREERLSLLMNKLDDTMATVFRQVAMNRFEAQIHGIRRSEGELSVERFGECWIENQREMFQGSVSLGNHYQIWWSYIPHFVHTPGYVYAYAFGELLALALYAIYQSNKTTFPDQYLKLLEAGGSDWPHVLLGDLGVDLRDSEFWSQGLNAIQTLIAQAEDLAQQVMD